MEPLTEIFVPGRGWTNLAADRVNREVQKYDERLRFGFNSENGDWIIYIRMPREFDSHYRIDGDPVYPVLGFGRDIPDPREALERLWKSDSLRHGTRILNELNRANERLKASQNAEVSGRVEEAAEHIEHHLRRAGDTEKYTKVFPTVTTKEKRG